LQGKNCTFITGQPTLLKIPFPQIEEALALINVEAVDDATNIFGTVIDSDMEDIIQITVIATGFDNQAAMTMPGPRSTRETKAMGQVANRPIMKPSEPVEDEEDFDTPTFIRRQAD
jgi:cell division protein FtsZ